MVRCLLFTSSSATASQTPAALRAFMLTLLPASATIIGAVVLRQIPTRHDLLGIALVMAGVALHRQAHLKTP
jgi:inner membrane transporter RhtA